MIAIKIGAQDYVEAVSLGPTSAMDGNGRSASSLVASWQIGKRHMFFDETA
jgi:hypothetical protein